jgi:hypothetical protein
MAKLSLASDGVAGRDALAAGRAMAYMPCRLMLIFSIREIP